MSQIYRDKLSEKIEALDNNKKMMVLQTLVEKFPVVMKEKVKNILKEGYQSGWYYLGQLKLKTFSNIAGEIKKLLQ